MTWVFIAILIVFSLIKIIPASLPSSVVEKILNKYKIHPQITPENCKVKYGDVQFIGGRKDEIIQYFNDANYLEKYYFAPEKNGEPLVISVTEGKRFTEYSLYVSSDYINVYKKQGKKEIAYSIRSAQLLEIAS